MNVIKINGEIYPLRFGINSIVEFEIITGKSIESVATNNSFSLESLRALFHAGLKGGDFKYSNSLIETGSLLEQALEEHGIEQVGIVISKALEHSMGKLKAPGQTVTQRKKKKKKKY